MTLGECTREECDQARADLAQARARIIELEQENRVLRSVIASHPGIRQAIAEAKAAIDAGDTITLEELEVELERHPDNADRIAERERLTSAVVDAARSLRTAVRAKYGFSVIHGREGTLDLALHALKAALDATPRAPQQAQHAAVESDPDPDVPESDRAEPHAGA